MGGIVCFGARCGRVAAACERHQGHALSRITGVEEPPRVRLKVSRHLNPGRVPIVQIRQPDERRCLLAPQIVIFVVEDRRFHRSARPGIDPRT